MTDRLFPADHADQELVRRLEAFADLRLLPSIGGATRMRAAVMGAAHRRSALVAADAAFGQGESSSRSRPGHAGGGGSWRRPFAAVMAGCLTLGLLTGTAIGARPGGPLYAVRLWTETANLPTDHGDRARAEASRLQERIDEAAIASSAGDIPAAEAALVAYSSIVIDAVEESRFDPRAAAELEATVKRQVDVLTRLVEVVPAPARPAAERALSTSTRALDDLEHRGGDEGPGRGTDRDGRGSRGGTGAEAPRATEEPSEESREGDGKGAEARETDAPPETQRPDRTDEPDETRQPDETHRPHEARRPGDERDD